MEEQEVNGTASPGTNTDLGTDAAKHELLAGMTEVKSEEEKSPATEEPLPEYMEETLAAFDEWNKDIFPEKTPDKPTAIGVDLTPLDTQLEEEGAWFVLKQRTLGSGLMLEPWTEEMPMDSTALKLAHYGHEAHAKLILRLREKLNAMFGPNHDLDDPTSVKSELRKKFAVARKQFGISQLMPLWKDARNLVDQHGKQYEFTEKTKILFLSQEQLAMAVLQATIERDPYRRPEFAENLPDSVPGVNGH